MECKGLEVSLGGQARRLSDGNFWVAVGAGLQMRLELEPQEEPSSELELWGHRRDPQAFYILPTLHNGGQTSPPSSPSCHPPTLQGLATIISGLEDYGHLFIGLLVPT